MLCLRSVYRSGSTSVLGRRCGIGLVSSLMAGLLMGSSCAPTANPTSATVTVDETIALSQAELPGLDHGPPRPIGKMIGPGDKPLEFVSGEIIYHPTDDADLQAFIKKYGATILRDGLPFVPPNIEMRAPAEASGWYLLHIDTSKSTMDDLGKNLAAAGYEGEYRFNSQDTARTLALFLRESSHGVGLNPIAHGDASIEHPDGSGGNIDAEKFPWFTEDDDPNTAGDQGLSVGVTHAWDYLSYKGILETDGIYYVPRIAILDGGFDLDETTGVPLHGNLDYNTLEAPVQWDLVDHDLTAGGENMNQCSGGSVCKWHGQGAFGIAAARPRNAFGSAGVGGKFVRTMLLKIDGDLFLLADAIRSATIGSADVISISSSGGCLTYHTLCSIPPDDIYDMMDSAVKFARTWGSTVVAAAGNDGIDIGDEEFYPCRTGGVICVGSVDLDKNNVFNFGSPVSIWAPTSMLSTVTPESADKDANNTGTDELYRFGGTSASTPFVAGVAGLMKTANPNLFYSQIYEILQNTANPSPDPRVTHGYVDAYRAVRGLLTNQPPTVAITSPLQDAAVGWKNKPLFKVNYSDPEVSPENIYRWHGVVVYSDELNGELCRSDSPPYTCSSTLSELTLGARFVTATATDAFGETGTSQVKINVVNRPPVPHIVSPLATDSVYSHIPIQFGAFAGDPDEDIPATSVTWTSNVDGVLGTGPEIEHLLTAGPHTITVTAIDGKNVSASDHVDISVISGVGLPLPQITSPPNHSQFGPGTLITLTAHVTDPEDGTLSGASLEWRSDLDGLLGTGTSIQVILSGPGVPCNPEFKTHTISLKAKDSNNHEVTVKIQISIGFVC